MPSVHPSLSFYAMTPIHTQLIVMTSAVCEKMTHYLETFSQKYMVNTFAIEVMRKSAFFHYFYITYNQWIILLKFSVTDTNGILSTNWHISANGSRDNSQVVLILFSWVDYTDGLEFICPSGKCILNYIFGHYLGYKWHWSIQLSCKNDDIWTVNWSGYEELIKALFINFSVMNISGFVKVSVRTFESHLYLTGATTAKLWGDLSNGDVMFNGKLVLCQFRMTGKIT